MEQHESDRLRALQMAIKQFNRERDWEQYHAPKNLAMALSAEVAEIVELFQWLTTEESRQLIPRKQSALQEELGDVMIYLTMLADAFGIDLLEAALKKLDLNARKYPVARVRGNSAKYSEY